MTATELLALAMQLLRAADYFDWGVILSPAAPSEVHHKGKTLVLYMGLRDQPWWYAKQAILHEIAHIDTYPHRPADDRTGGHHQAFYLRFGALCQQLAAIVPREDA